MYYSTLIQKYQGKWVHETISQNTSQNRSRHKRYSQFDLSEIVLAVLHKAGNIPIAADLF